MTKDIRYPLFIAGFPCKAGKVLAHAIAGSLDISSCGEGHVWPVVRAVHAYIHAATQSAAVVGGSASASILACPDRDAFLKKYIRFLDAEHARVFGTNRWLDHTPGPEMLHAMPVFRPYYARAGWVLLKQNAVSYVFERRKQTRRSVFTLCREWENMAAAYEACLASLGGAFLELDSDDVLTKPSIVAGALASYLGLSLPAEKGLADALASAASSVNFNATGEVSPLSFEAACWEESERKAFSTYCVNGMRALGYSFSSSLKTDGLRSNTFLSFSRLALEKTSHVHGSPFIYDLVLRPLPVAGCCARLIFYDLDLTGSGVLAFTASARGQQRECGATLQVDLVKQGKVVATRTECFRIGEGSRIELAVPRGLDNASLMLTVTAHPQSLVSRGSTVHLTPFSFVEGVKGTS